MGVVDKDSHLKAMRELAAAVRVKMRDFSELNRLIVGEESNERMILWAVVDTIADFNDTPPPIGELSIFDLPKSIIIQGTIARTLQSVITLLSRNSISFSDGGISISTGAQVQLMFNLYNMINNDYESKKGRWKASTNLTNGLREKGLPSEYININNFYYGVLV